MTTASGLVILRVAGVDKVDEGLRTLVAAAINSRLDHIGIGHALNQILVLDGELQDGNMKNNKL